MSQSGVDLKTLLILKGVCCGLPLLLIVLASTGGLAVAGAWLGLAWPFLVALAILALGVWLWRRRTRSCGACARPRWRDGRHGQSQQLSDHDHDPHATH